MASHPNQDLFLSENFISAASTTSSSSRDSSMSNHVHDPNLDAATSSSSATFSTPSVLPVPFSSQLDIVLPLSTSSISTSVQADALQGIQTRLKTGTIIRNDYTALAAVCPHVQTLELHDCTHFSGGFTFVADITDASKPSNFRVVSQIPHWQQAMQEEYDALEA